MIIAASNAKLVTDRKSLNRCRVEKSPSRNSEKLTPNLYIESLRRRRRPSELTDEELDRLRHEAW